MLKLLVRYIALQCNFLCTKTFYIFLQLGIKTRLQDFAILYRMRNSEWHIICIHTDLMYMLCNSCDQDEQAYQTTVYQVLLWEVHSCLLPLHHTTLLHACLETGEYW